MAPDSGSLSLAVLGVAAAAAAAATATAYVVHYDYWQWWKQSSNRRQVQQSADRLADVQVVINALQKYSGIRVVGLLRIPNTGNKKHTDIDIVVITHRKIYVVEVKSWSGRLKLERTEIQEKIDSLVSYISRRGLSIPASHFHGVVVVGNCDCRVMKVFLPMPDVMSLDQWESFVAKETKKYTVDLMKFKKLIITLDIRQQLHAILSTAPTWDRLSFTDGLATFGKFMHFKGSEEDMHSLNMVKRSRMSTLIIVHITSKVAVYFTERDYRHVAASRTMNKKATSKSTLLATVSPNAVVVFQDIDAELPQEFLLGKVACISFSA